MQAKIRASRALFILDIYGQDLSAAPVYRAYFDTLEAAKSAAAGLGASIYSIEGA